MEDVLVWVTVATFFIAPIIYIVSGNITDSKKEKQLKIVAKILGAICAVSFVIVLVMSIAGASGGGSSTRDYDNYMAGQDWGRDYFYDSGSHQVRRKLFH